MKAHAKIISCFGLFVFALSSCQSGKSAATVEQPKATESKTKEDTIAIKQINANGIPSSIQSKDKWLDGYSWMKNDQHYYFIVRAKSSNNKYADTWMKEIVFQQYKTSANDMQPVLTWEQKDFADFNKLEGIVYQKEKSSVKKASQNILISMVYQKVRDGLDADTLKLVEWVDDKKLSVKGLIAKQDEDKEKIGKSISADKSLQADKRLIQSAENKWLQYRKEYMLEY